MGILKLSPNGPARRSSSVGLSLILLAAIFSGCGRAADSTPPTPPSTAEPSAFIITGDFETGSYAVMETRDPSVVAADLGPVHGDAVARTYRGEIFVINRFGADSIQKIAPAAGWTTRYQCSVGNGSNPHDIVFVSPTKAYVTRYEETSIAIVNPSVNATCEGFLVGEIDLGSFADADGIASSVWA